jgi:glucan biosynthesis protein C
MERHYGMDWLRIGAFGLLILYHIGMFFVPWGWHVKTAEPIEWLRVPMLATNAWRLELLFLVSGFASAALLATPGGLGKFVRSRTARLVVPLVFAAVLIIPPQPWIELQFKHGYAGSYWHFWTADYFRFGALDGIILPTWQHLWFVVYLWVYTLMLALLLAVISAKARAWLAAGVDRMLGGVLVLIVPLALALLNTFLSWPGAEPTHALVDDWHAHRVYFLVFLFGVFLFGAERAWAGIRRWWKVAGIMAIIAYAAVALIQSLWIAEYHPGFDMRPWFAVARNVQAWGAIVALIGIADRFWNRDHPWRATLTEAVFPFYIIHQTIIVVLGWYLLPFHLPAAVEFALLVAATVAGCWIFYDAGRRIGWLRPLIGLRMAKRSQPARQAPID